MADQRIDLLNASVNFFDGNCWQAPYATLNSGTTNNPMVLIMDQGVVSFIISSIVVPAFTGTPQIEVIWTSETTTNDVDFALRHRAVDGNDITLLDISTSPTERSDTSLNNTGPSAASEQMITAWNLTTTDLVAGRLLQYEFERDGATDTKAAEISIWGLNLLYTPVT